MAEATYRRKHFLFVSQVSLGSPGHPETIPVVQADLEHRVLEVVCHHRLAEQSI